MGVTRRPTWSTLTAAGLMAAVSLIFAVYALSAISGIVPDRISASRDAILLGLDAQQANNATAMAAGLILAISVLTLSLSVGVALRRVGARHAAMLVFGVLGFISLAAAVPGLQSTPPRAGAGYGVLVGLVDIAAVGLLLMPTTADDFELVERERERQLARR